MIWGSITYPRHTSGFSLTKVILVHCAFIACFLSHHGFVPWKVLTGRFDTPCMSSQMQRDKRKVKKKAVPLKFKGVDF